MAYPETDAERKVHLIAELKQTRSSLARNVRGARENLNVATQVKKAIVKQKFAWFTGAALTGLLLTKLPRRKKYPPRSLPAHHPEGGSKDKTGLLLGALGLAFSLLRPAITSIATQKLAEFVANRSFDSEPPRTPRASGARR